MGWTTVEVDFKSSQTVKIKEFFEKEYTSETVGGYQIKVLYQHLVGRTLYQALEYKKDDDVQVMANVILYSVVGGELCWKAMLETAGPGKDEANKRLLNLLSPTDSQYALDWRKRCQLNIDKKKIQYEDGDIIQFAKDIHFRSDLNFSRFILRKRPSRKGGVVTRFEVPGYKYEFNIRSWKNINHTIEKGDY